MKKMICLLLAIVAASLPAFPGEVQNHVEWDKDVDVLIQKIEKYHPDPWARISKSDFFEKVSQMKKTISSKSDEQITVEMMRLIALLRDGHTQVCLNNQERFNKWFPLRLEKFADGIFITAITNEHADCLGARVLRMDDMEMDKVYNLLGGVLSVDSDRGIPRIVSNYLSNAVILKALNILKSDKQVQLELQFADMKKRLTLESSKWDLSFNWAWSKNAVPSYRPATSFFDQRKQELPLYLRKVLTTRDSYWFEFIAEDGILYFQFNEVSNSGPEPWNEFIEKLFNCFDQHMNEIEKFVIDVRFNEGGNGKLLDPLVSEFTKRRAILSRGKLFIITGPETFSAASNFIGQMLDNTNVISVGDIASGPLNWYSDVINFTLPNSRLLIDISTMYWQKGHATDNRGYYPPDYYIPATAKDYFSGHDAVMDAIKNNRVKSLKDVLLQDGIEAFKTEYAVRVKQNGVPGKWFPYLPFDLVVFSIFELGRNGKIDEALALSELNIQLYPDDIRAWFALAMILEAKNDLVNALACMEKLTALEPNMTEGLWNVERIRTLLYPIQVDMVLLKKYAGQYGIRNISFENGSLFYQKEGGKKRRLIPMTMVCFLLEGDDDNRVEIVNQRGEVEGIRILNYNGTSRFYSKTSD